MEFHYRVSPKKQHSFWFEPILIFLLLAFLHFFVLKGGLGEFIFYSIVFGGWGFSAGYRKYKFYKKSSESVLKLDDCSISLEEEGTVISFSWDEINKVTWGQSSKDTDFQSIVIKGLDKEIIVGGNIDGFSEIIQFVKRKVGDRFITYDVPWELKYPKKKT